jgi:hypothetical protein
MVKNPHHACHALIAKWTTFTYQCSVILKMPRRNTTMARKDPTMAKGTKFNDNPIPTIPKVVSLLIIN